MNLDHSPSLALVAVIGVLVATGVYLMLERSLTRVLLGIILIGNGVNLSFLVAGGAAGGPPLVGTTPTEDMSDPLPQAMVLTAIVITLGLSAFLLAMAYRSWQLNGHDEVQDDLEDQRIARLAAADQPAVPDADTEDGQDLEEEAVGLRDEVVFADRAAREPAPEPRPQRTEPPQRAQPDGAGGAEGDATPRGPEGER